MGESLFDLGLQGLESYHDGAQLLCRLDIFFFNGDTYLLNELGCAVKCPQVVHVAHLNHCQPSVR